MKRISSPISIRLQTVLMIGFSLLMIGSFCGCATWGKSNHVEWIMPDPPKLKSTRFSTIKKGSNVVVNEDIMFTNEEGSKNLLYNIDEMDAYIKKLQILIAKMQKYYEGK